MNSWKEYPHQFANRKFQVNVNGVNPIYDKARTVIGYINSIGENDGWFKLSEVVSVPTESCTLIARKIEDMTDEEIHEIRGAPYHSDVCAIIREGWIKDARIQKMSGRVERLLADIGVYFLDQSHFRKDVIDIKTLEGK